MGTRSQIGLVRGNTVTYIYCHWDGNPGYNGMILKQYYTDATKVKQLLEMGDLSSLGAHPITKENWKRLTETQQSDQTTEGYRRYAFSYDNWRNEVCPSRKSTLEDFIKEDRESWIEFRYYFLKGKWYCVDERGNPVEIKRESE